jgi:hypothetical protein
VLQERWINSLAETRRIVMLGSGFSLLSGGYRIGVQFQISGSVAQRTLSESTAGVGKTESCPVLALGRRPD